MTSAIVLVAALGFQAACGGSGREESTRIAGDDATSPSGVTPDPSAERQVITLTGCVQQGVPGEFTLASVVTAGVLDAAPPRQEGAAEYRPDPASQAAAVAASSYRLVTTDDDHDLTEYVGQRVTVAGRLANESGTTQASPEGARTGTEVTSEPTHSTVVGNAPSLRGFYVTSLRKVSDTCSATATGDRDENDERK
jgi:hypothetical protein